ncbi:hypothetical protein GGR57DRAFT_518097 [Xylariaceae sp. FL1272]|nr:hypothetical protein GGR57DRAFT_518097 [Xylariaceae sp. FL1272]
MYLWSFFVATISVTVASAYTIDPSLEDGVYFIPMKTNISARFQGFGTEPLYDEPIRIADVAPRAAATELSNRDPLGVIPIPADSHACYNTTEIPWHYQEAHDLLSRACFEGAKIPAWNHVSGVLLARFANSVAFACSWGRRQGCAPNEIDNAWDQITSNCGKIKGGHICASPWKKCYGHTTYTSSICNNDV